MKMFTKMAQGIKVSGVAILGEIGWASKAEKDRILDEDLSDKLHS
jgi:hypothetical protein